MLDYKKAGKYIRREFHKFHFNKTYWVFSKVNIFHYFIKVYNNVIELKINIPDC